MTKRWISGLVIVAVVGSVLLVVPAVSAQAPPVGFDARRDIVYVDPDTTVVVDVLENDIDAVADAVHEVSIVTGPGHPPVGRTFRIGDVYVNATEEAAGSPVEVSAGVPA